MPSASILFVGNLVGVKAPGRALAAFAAFAKTGTGTPCLEIVGDGPLRKQLVKQVAVLGLAGRVRFHGRQPPGKVAEMMRQASCLLLTSRSEGMPNVVVESLACGTPVVATAVGEVPFLIENDKTGFCVEVNGQSPEEEAGIVHRLAAAIETTLNVSWAEKNIASTVKDFTWEEAARVILKTVKPS